jgi:hypothetical protein
MKYRLNITAMIAAVMLVGCATLAEFAMDAVSPSKGGINTELVVGDKNQTLGTNQEVKANTVGTVVGQNDNHTDIAKADDVSITNQNYPGWLIILLLAGNIVFLCMPTPTNTFKWIARKFKNESKL